MVISCYTVHTVEITGGYDRWNRRWTVRVVDAWGRVRSEQYAVDRKELKVLLLGLRRKHGWRIATSSRWLDRERGGNYEQCMEGQAG